MSFTDSQFAQLIIALGIGLVMFVIAYAASEKSVVSVLVATLPFQPITSGYGTLNTVTIFMVGLIFLLRGRIKKFPLFGLSLFILFVLLLSTSQVHSSTYLDHFFYIVMIVANFVLFYIVYNYFIQKQAHADYAIKLFLFSGFLVLVASTLKLVFNFDPSIAFGIDELATTGNLEGLQRFVGSFNAAGVNGAFHGTQMVLVAFALMFKPKPMTRLLLLILFVSNAAFLVATGSRGAFLSSAGGLVLLLFVFIRRLGMGRVLALSFALPALFITAAMIIINFTTYNVLFDRLKETEFKGFTPDTRDFSIAIERIPENIMLGHGPRLWLRNQHLRRVPGYIPMGYPHNLYLHILFTVGVLGLVAYLAWFLGVITRYLRAFKYRSDSPMLNGMPRLGLVIMIMFLVDELKIEALRFSLSDYQQFMFALWAMLLAMSDRAVIEGRKAMELQRLDKLR